VNLVILGKYFKSSFYKKYEIQCNVSTIYYDTWKIYHIVSVFYALILVYYEICENVCIFVIVSTDWFMK